MITCYQCYDCDNRETPECGDPFIATNATDLKKDNAPVGGVCRVSNIEKTMPNDYAGCAFFVVTENLAQNRGRYYYLAYAND